MSSIYDLSAEERADRLFHLAKDLDMCRSQKCDKCPHYNGGKRRDWCGLRLNERLAAFGIGGDI